MKETNYKPRFFEFNVRNVAYAGLFAALSYVVFTFLQVKIPLPGGDATSFHLGNAVVAIGSLLIGGFWGGLGGALGMTIGDLFDPVYVVYAPKTLICKLIIGLVTDLVAHRILKINNITERGRLLAATVIASVCGLGANCFFDPLIGYFYKIAILGKPAAEVALKWNIVTTTTNAFLSVIACTILYMALRKPLKKAGIID